MRAVDSLAGGRVAVLGGGPIGTGVAALALMGGAQAALWSRQETTRRRAHDEIRQVLLVHSRRGALSEPADALLARLRLCPTVGEAVAGAAWVVEAVVEEPEAKRSLLREAEAALAEASYLATTASWLPISLLAQALARPERFLGLHFYNPPWRRDAVEVIPGERTAAETLLAAEAFLQSLGQRAALLQRDHPGFVGNRLILRQFEEGILAVAEGMPPQAVDAAYRDRLGFPFGPCESLDYIGLDFIRRLFQVANRWNWDAPDRAIAFLKECIEQGRTGAAAGQGLYAYPTRRWERQPLARGASAAVDSVSLFAPTVLEATRLVQRGVAAPETVEMIASQCIGWGQGPLAVARRLGLEAIQEALAGRYRREPALRYESDDSLEAVLASRVG